MSPKKMVAKDSAAKMKKDDRGLRVADPAKLHGHSSSTICTILKKKEEIKKVDVAKGLTKQHPNLVYVVEKLLLV